MIKGWCPSLFKPMMAADGLLLRVQAPFAKMQAEQARVLAKATADDGNGELELTRRGKLQARGFSNSSQHDFVEKILDVDLASVDAELESWRSKLLLPPLSLADDA